ncbi:MAG: alcohol dehydrogenase catalytic domain-containing protein [Anaerolineae bacterium]|nr:alcohol dehydrogenase catalytic domain-containing protein [Anaerolineae bacterium]
MKVINALIRENGEFILQERDMPHPRAGEVVVRVAGCGICGTDLNLYNGKRPKGWRVTFPFQMGHELSGIIHAVGDGVPDEPGLRVGDRVVPDGRLPCGYCRYCRRGHENLCLHQGYIAGGFAQYAVYPYKNLVKVPAGMDLVEAAFTEPLACCVNGNNKLVDLPLGGIAVVLGMGPIGLLHLQLLRNRGLSTIAVDLKESRLEMAAALGAAHTLKVERPHEVDPELINRVKELTGGFGADVVVTAAGLDPAVLEQALQMAARQGQVLYFAATLSDPVTLNLDVIHYQELRLVGSHDSTRADYEKALALMASGSVRVGPLISHRYPLDRIQDAFRLANERSGLKVFVVNEGVV